MLLNKVIDLLVEISGCGPVMLNYAGAQATQTT